MKIFTIIGTIVLLAFFSCSKKDKEEVTPTEIHCEVSNLCVQNATNDTVFYCWGCNYWADTLLPGSTKCMDGGSVHMTATTQSYSTHSLNAFSHGNYTIVMDVCEYTQVIN